MGAMRVSQNRTKLLVIKAKTMSGNAIKHSLRNNLLHYTVISPIVNKKIINCCTFNALVQVDYNMHVHVCTWTDVCICITYVYCVFINHKTVCVCQHLHKCMIFKFTYDTNTFLSVSGTNHGEITGG